MRKSKRMLAVLCTLLMLASCFALPYGAAAEETAATLAELQAKYPNADPSEPYYVVGRFQNAGEKTTTTSEVKASGNEAQPWTCTGGDVTIIAPDPIDISSWDTTSLAVVVDITISRQDGKTGVNKLQNTGNQRMQISNGSTAVIQTVGSPYLTHFTTDYANRAGDTITYVVPWEYVNGTTAIKKTEDTTVDRFFWSVFNDTYKVDTDDDEDTDPTNNPVGLNVTIENARIVDLSRDGQGYLTGTKALYHTDVVQIGNSSWGNLWTLYNFNNPLYSDITDLSKGNYELRFDAKVNPYGYFVAKPCDADGNVVTPDSSLSNYGIAQFKTAFYVNYEGVPEEDIPYLQYGSASAFNPGWVKLNGVQTNTSPTVYSDWTSFSYDVSDSFSGISDTLTSLLVQRYNNNYISVDGKVVRFTGNDLTTITSVGGNDGNRYALPMMSSVRDIRIVDTDLEALNKAVQAVRNSLYDDIYAAALEEAEAVLLDTDPTAEEIAAAVSALENGTATDHTDEVVATFPSWEKEVHNTSSNSTGKIMFMNWNNASSTADLTDGQTYSVTQNEITETRGVLGSNRYLMATVTVSRNAAYEGNLALKADATLPALTELEFRFQSPRGNSTFDSNTERRTNSYHMPVTSSVENEDGSVTYTLELLLDNSADNWKDSTTDRRLDWSQVVNLWGNWTFDSQIAEKADNSETNVTLNVEELKLVDKTIEKLTSELAELSTLKGDYVPNGDWTAFETEQAAAVEMLQAYNNGDASVTLMDVQAEVATLETLYDRLVNLSEEVATFSNQEYQKKVADVGRSQYWYDWISGDGLNDTNTVNLTDGTGENVVGDNRYFQLTVTLERNTAYTGDITVADLSALLKNVQVRLQAPYESRPDGVAGECRSDSFTMTILNTVVDGDKITYTMEGILDETLQGGDTRDMNWSKLKACIIFVNLNQELRADGTEKSADIPVYCTLSDVKIVNKTKALKKAELEVAATETDVYVENEALETYKAAQDAAKALLKDENAYYSDLQKALEAIETAKANLNIIGHVVKDFSDWNGSVNYSSGNSFYKDWLHGDKVIDADLSKYDKNQLHVRMNVNFAPVGDASIEGITISTVRMGVRSYVGVEQMITYQPKFNWGDNVVDIAWNDFSESADKPIHMDAVNNITLIVELKKDGAIVTEAADMYTMTIDNARIVDVTAEENLGTVETVGNGAIEITGDYVYGGDDELTAKEGANSTFVGWKINDTFVGATDETISQTLPITGRQNVTAYFVDADETAVIYYGKYNRVIDVKIAKDGEMPTAPDAPTIVGQKFIGWDTTDDALKGAIVANAGGSTSVQATYDTVKANEGNGYTVSLVNATRTNGNELTGLNFDDRIVVQASAPTEGATFSYWTVNGNIAAYTDTFTFYVSGDMTVKAVYGADNATPVPSAAINQAIYILAEEGADKPYTISMIAQTYMPVEDYDLMEYGLIFAPKAETAEKIATGNFEDLAEGTDYITVVSSSRTPNRQYQIDLRKVAEGKTRYGVAYLTVRHKETQEVVKVYSQPKNVTTPTAG